ncbi:bifunctional diguanylate cyclase/phosphodiesterase [Paenibacillus sp. R14(2021)]|uniref:putative bifunctional diguanylate cyclase/phosphodiesterase n=1 Tax=Paenibacillus sp. R14(2021) TaxID=2859228 RepID=UPI001C6124DA|nr:EAL domain-containing protein [Paenibacillus sp. R14(2021)]
MMRADVYLLFMLAPLLFLFQSSVDIYRRNPGKLENRMAAAAMLLLFLLSVLDFTQMLLPVTSIAYWYAYVKYPVTLLLAGTSLCLHVTMTRGYHRIPYQAGVTAALLPVAVYMLQAVLQGPHYFVKQVTVIGHWKLDEPSGVWLVYVMITFVIWLANNALAYSAWKQTADRGSKGRFLILIRSNLLFMLAFGVCAAVCAIFRLQLPLPSIITSLPVLVWGISIRLMMINTDFLPQLAGKYEAFFQLSPAPILILDRQGRILEANPRAVEMFGIHLEGQNGQVFESFLIPADQQRFHDRYAADFPNICWQGEEMALWSADGQLRTVLMDMAALAENGEPYVLTILSDITQRKAVERQTDYLAHYDALTGLPNRISFKHELEEALARENHPHQFDAVLLVDLDRFKLINDTLGHHNGDELLKLIAARFRECLSPDMGLARAGGDEFMILVRGAAEYDEIIWIAEKLQQALESPVCLHGAPFFITASVGISLFPSDGNQADVIIKNADIAMYHAKSKGGGQYRFFSKELNSSINRMVEMEANLRKALDEDEFIIQYQPQTNIGSGRTIGAEALVRWNSKVYGMVSPADFIPLAEQTGLILRLGQWVMEEACREAKRWERGGWPSMVVSVNVSVKQFMQPDFVAEVRRILEETGLEARKLYLEITESVVIDKLEVTLKMLDELVAMGVEIAIDDFGTGYSSLSILRQLPISIIKIDRSFIGEMVEAESVRTVVSTMISMTHSLGKTVVAEGIETEEQLAWLKAMGCDKGQGYYIDKPLSAEMMRNRLKKSS